MNVTSIHTHHQSASPALSQQQQKERLWQLLEEVKDPEVPALSILDLGIVRHLDVSASGIKLVITPTYSGCPAMDVISMDIRLKLMEHGYRALTIEQQLSPAWTTDWMTEAGKQKLEAFGIAPPRLNRTSSADLFVTEEVPCPHCQSVHTELISQFSSTACKAMYRCTACKEAFDYFKCH